MADKRLLPAAVATVCLGVVLHLSAMILGGWSVREGSDLTLWNLHTEFLEKVREFQVSTEGVHAPNPFATVAMVQVSSVLGGVLGCLSAGTLLWMLIAPPRKDSKKDLLASGTAYGAAASIIFGAFIWETELQGKLWEPRGYSIGTSFVLSTVGGVLVLVGIIAVHQLTIAELDGQEVTPERTNTKRSIPPPLDEALNSINSKEDGNKQSDDRSTRKASISSVKENARQRSAYLLGGNELLVVDSKSDVGSDSDVGSHSDVDSNINARRHAIPTARSSSSTPMGFLFL